MVASQGFDLAEATRGAAVANDFGFLDRARPGDWLDEEVFHITEMQSVLGSASIMLVERSVSE
jgi:hypothetical protein